MVEFSSDICETNFIDSNLVKLNRLMDQHKNVIIRLGFTNATFIGLDQVPQLIQYNYSISIRKRLLSRQIGKAVPN